MLDKAIKQPTRLVALDTQVFDMAQFNYQSRSFKTLMEMVQEEKIYLYLTTVNQQEIISQIKYLTEQAASAFKKLHQNFRKEANIIYNAPKYRGLLTAHLDEEELYKELIEQFNNFLKESETEILPVNTVAAEDIFAKYFKTLPPFKKGQKKHEFPDAFALASIEEKARNENRKIYVVSGDKDWLEASSQSEYLIYKESIDKLLAEIIEQEYQELDLCYKNFDDNFEAIKNDIKDSFIEKEFVLNDDFAYYAEIGSEDIEVEVDMIEIIDRSIVNIDDEDADNPLILFELKVDISYTAHIKYNSMENAFWDSEDHQYYNIENAEHTVHLKIEMPVEAELLFFRNGSYNLCLNSVESVDLDPNTFFGSIVIDPAIYYEQQWDSMHPWDI